MRNLKLNPYSTGTGSRATVIEKTATVLTFPNRTHKRQLNSYSRPNCDQELLTRKCRSGPRKQILCFVSNSRPLIKPRSGCRKILTPSETLSDAKLGRTTGPGNGSAHPARTARKKSKKNPKFRKKRSRLGRPHSTPAARPTCPPPSRRRHDRPPSN